MNGSDSALDPDTGFHAGVVELRALEPGLTRGRLDSAVTLAAEAGCAAVCVAAENVSFVRSLLGTRTRVVGVAGFPHGTSLAATKAFEAAALVAHGADAVEMVLSWAPIAEGDLEHVTHEVTTVREAVPDTVLRVTVEAARWNPAVLRAVCDAAIGGGADMLVSSTGFDPAGVASPDAVATMLTTAGRRANVVALVDSGPSAPLDALGSIAALIDLGVSGVGISADSEGLELLARTVAR